MNLYGSKPQELAMQRLIHDTNNLLDRMRFQIKRQDEWLKANAKTITAAIGKNDSTMWVTTEYLRSTEKELERAIDNYYEKFKADFPDPLLNQKEAK